MDAMAQLPPFTYVMTHLDLYNWGAFASRHCALIDLEGTAVIGPTGSGKTTLIDALMTLIVQNPRYNLASTSGDESDRDLVSYVRGVSRAGNNTGDNEHIARPGPTVTGIAARFGNGEKTVCLAALFKMDGTSSAQSDLKRLWIFSEAEDQTFDAWLTAYHEGGARAVKQLGKEISGLHVYENKQAFLAHVRRFFEVGENAFALLNRAAGLKQLKSIDEIFHELVLEDASAFERANEVAREFDTLAEIHAELEIAREQRNALEPIERDARARGMLQERVVTHRILQKILPVWYATHAHRLWSAHAGELKEKVEACEQQALEVQQNIQRMESEVNTLRDLYLQSGGLSIEQLRSQIELQERHVAERRTHAEQYQKLIGRLGLNAELTPDALTSNQQAARERTSELVALFEKQKSEAWTLGANVQSHARTLQELEEELKDAQARPHSNIPHAYQKFRTELAEYLQLSEDALPYVAELVEVKAQEGHWQGAIERAIGGHRLRVLVPSEAMKNALRWVNDRNNRLHVRLLHVGAHQEVRTFFADGYLRKLNFKAHPHREAAKAFLSGIDRHCVSSSDALHGIPYGLTEQGLMSGQSGQFDKHDQRPLDEDWWTGFDNRSRVARLKKQEEDARAALAEARRVCEVAQHAAERTQAMITLLEGLLLITFESIDLPRAIRELETLTQTLQALIGSDPDAEKAGEAWEAAKVRLDALRGKEKEVERAKSGWETQRNSALQEQSKAFRRTGKGLTNSELSLADQQFKTPAASDLSSLDELERSSSSQIQDELKAFEEKLKRVEADLIRAMEKAKKVDTGALAEVGTDLTDIPSYLERLRQLIEEALPEKLRRFQSYLNQSSDQGVTQLLSDVENEVAIIEERIQDLNSTLRRVEFQPGCHLRLEPTRVVHESLRELQQAQRHLRSAALKDDEGESHFKALKNMVELLRDAAERRKTVGARALLDPRYRLTFAVSVITSATGAILETRTGSQGGSGGEKEIMASYVLTASLSYALCPEAGGPPLFGTIVLDEAFSRSSHSIASRIISALNEFGLHPLFVTPNKELRLLREHTRSAILVHRKGQRASLASLSWEELDAHARTRKTADAG
jgi:uncharacterized protein YPO0396